MVIFVNYFASKCECYDVKEDCTVATLLEYLAKAKGIPKDVLKVIYNGHYVSTQQSIRNNSTVHVVLSLCGGKGGFGSMLRAIGAQIEKTTNREACRDLSGRRLRDINEEQRLKRWISKKAEREKEAAVRRRRKLEQMCSLPKHDFHDEQYDRERRDLTERIDDSLTHGLKVATGSKRKVNEDDSPLPKKNCLWVGVNTNDDDDDEHIAEEVSSCCDEGSSNSFTDISDKNESTSQATDESQDASNSLTFNAIPDSGSTSQDAGENLLKEATEEEEPSLDLEQPQKTDEEKPMDLPSFNCIEELEELGLDRLKLALQDRGMKCGGTLRQRAERLWLVRGLDHSEISPNLLAKPPKSKK